MLTTLFVVNIIISILHPMKHIPQCLYMIQHENADGLSMIYIQGEMVLNTLTTMVSISLFLHLHHAIYLLPIIFEKIMSLSMIAWMMHLKQKYTSTNQIDEYVCESDSDSYSNYDDWHSVSSCDSDTDHL
jgi:hypothetical protein